MHRWAYPTNSKEKGAKKLRVNFQFITLKNGDERSRLIPVLNTILKLSPEETHQLNQIAGGKKLGPYSKMKILKFS